MFEWLTGVTTKAAADLYMDLGTANTLIAARGHGVILNEPSLVAYAQAAHQGGAKKKVLSVGLDARDMLTKTPGNVHAQRPIRDGVIADFESTEAMLKHFLSKPNVKSLFSRPRLVVSLPYGATEVEKRAVIESCKFAGAREVYLIDEPMAAAIGAGMNVRGPRGCLIVDIGGGTTEVAMIALGDIVYCEGIRVGGYRIDETIIDYFRKYKNLIVSEATAEHLKMQVGTAVPKKDIRYSEVHGRDGETGLIKKIEVSSEEVGLAMNECIQDIINAIHKAIEKTPPELVADVIESGLVLAGGGALIRDLDVRIQNEIRLNVRIADNPLTTIAIGGEMVLKDPDLLEKIRIEP